MASAATPGDDGREPLLADADGGGGSVTLLTLVLTSGWSGVPGDAVNAGDASRTGDDGGGGDEGGGGGGGARRGPKPGGAAGGGAPGPASPLPLPPPPPQAPAALPMGAPDTAARGALPPTNVVDTEAGLAAGRPPDGPLGGGGTSRAPAAPPSANGGAMSDSSDGMGVGEPPSGDGEPPPPRAVTTDTLDGTDSRSLGPRGGKHRGTAAATAAAAAARAAAVDDRDGPRPSADR